MGNIFYKLDDDLDLSSLFFQEDGEDPFKVYYHFVDAIPRNLMKHCLPSILYRWEGTVRISMIKLPLRFCSHWSEAVH